MRDLDPECVFFPPFQAIDLKRAVSRLLEERDEDFGYTLDWLCDHQTETAMRKSIEAAWKSTQLPVAEFANDIRRIGVYHDASAFSLGSFGIAVELERAYPRLLMQQAPMNRNWVSSRLCELLDGPAPSSLVDVFAAVPGIAINAGVVLAHREFLDSPGERLARGPLTREHTIDHYIRSDGFLWSHETFALEILLDYSHSWRNCVVITRDRKLLVCDAERHRGLMTTTTDSDQFLARFFMMPFVWAWNSLLSDVNAQIEPIKQVRAGSEVRERFKNMARDEQICVACYMLMQFCENRGEAEIWSQLSRICRTVSHTFLDGGSVPQATRLELSEFSSTESTIQLVVSGDRDAVMFIQQVEFVAGDVDQHAGEVGYPEILLFTPDPKRQPMYECAHEAMNAILREKADGSPDPARSAMKVLLEKITRRSR